MFLRRKATESSRRQRQIKDKGPVKYDGVDWGEILHYVGKWYQITWPRVLNLPMVVLFSYYEWAKYDEAYEEYKSSLRLF